MYRPEYATHLNVFLWLLVATGIGYFCSFVGYAVTAARYFAIQVPIFVVSIVIIVGACAVLVPSHGLVGAAWAMCIMLIAQLPMKGAAIVYALRKRPSPSAAASVATVPQPPRAPSVALPVAGGAD
jgi:O-antigen/teichoic acid export membrane protein